MDGSIALPLGHMNRSPQEFPTVVACSAAESPLPDLVRSAQSGDRTAFGELFQRFRGFVYACALARLRNPQRSEELVSDVFAHVLTKLTQLRDPACFPSWLRRVTTRMAINASVRGFRPVSFEEGEEPEAGSATVAEVLAAEAREVILQALPQLRPIDRETLTDFYLQGLSLKNISRLRQTPVGTIKRRLHYARRRLRAIVESLEG